MVSRSKSRYRDFETPDEAISVPLKVDGEGVLPFPIPLERDVAVKMLPDPAVLVG